MHLGRTGRALADPAELNPLPGIKALNSVLKKGSIISETTAWRVDGAVFQVFPGF